MHEVKEDTMQVPSLPDLLKSGIHFGHKESRWHPKMAPYIYSSRNGIHIIDLEQTQKKLESAMFFLKQLGLRGGNLLVVGTKEQARGILETIAKEQNLPYVTGKWLGGTLTNFGVVSKKFRTLQDLQTAEQDPLYEEKYTKWERLQFTQQKEELLKSVGGIISLTTIPDAVFLIDIKRDSTALAEARKKNVTTIAIVDTNVNPEKVDFPIPGNDDAIKGIKLITECIVGSFVEGRKEAEEKNKNQESGIKNQG